MGGLRVAIFGAANIGRYHAREYNALEEKVVAVLGTTPESSKLAANNLRQDFDIVARHYHSLEDMLNKEKLDAVSICTSPNTHYVFVKAALERGLHVLCEKPLHWDLKATPEENLRKAEELLALATKQDLILAVNTQLAALFDAYLDGYKNNRQFSFGNVDPISFRVHILTSGKGDGLYIPMDLLPHALSLLLRLEPQKKAVIDDLKGETSELETNLSFNFYTWAKTINTSIMLGRDPLKKEISFGFEDIYVTRTQGTSQDNIVYYLVDKDIRIGPIKDPLAVSVKSFCDTVRTNDKSQLLVSPEEALANMKLQYQLMDYLIKQKK